MFTKKFDFCKLYKGFCHNRYYKMKLTKKTYEEIRIDPSIVEEYSIDDLVYILRKTSEKYYKTGVSEFDDDIYDFIKEVLMKKDPTNEFLTEIGAPIKGEKNKVKLPFGMGSLNKIKPDTGDLERWIKKNKGPYVLSDKMDGVSAQIYKDKDGKINMYTRGDGKTGQEITHLLKLININKECIEKTQNDTSIRGELIMTKSDFKKFGDKKNARNAIAGLVNSKTIDTKIAKHTKFIAYSILHPRYTNVEQMKMLSKWNYDVVFHKTVKKIDDNILSKYLTDRKKDNDFDIDGIVCSDDSKIHRHEDGYPSYSFAFKMITSDQIGKAEVEEVIWQPSMDGYLKPTIRIKPIELVGTTITYATAHNAKFVFDKIIGKGAIIEIIRSGDVIPKIMSVIKKAKSGKPDMPTIEYKWNDTNVDIIAINASDNTKKKINTQIISHFFKTMDIKYISDGIITKLVENGYNTIFKILEAEPEELVHIDGIGEKLVKKIYEEIEKQFGSCDLAKLMASSRQFGRGMGERKLREILAIYPNIMKIKNTTDELKEKIMAVNGFSDIMSNKFVDNFNKFKVFFNKINEIYDITHLANPPSVKTGNSMEDVKVVFTGFRDKHLEEYIVKNGGKVTTSVSKNTTVLIHADDADTSSSKFKKAEDVGVKIMSKSQFIKHYKISI